MTELVSKIESLLFVESKPLSYNKIAKICDASEQEVLNAITELQQQYDARQGGIVVVTEGKKVQFMTAASQAEFIAEYLNAEATGELTRPALETVTIIAYRGPVSKSEIELIRGVNCSLILRNLQIRGLAEQVGITETESPIYQVTIDFLRHLGVNKTTDLPDFEHLNQNVHLQELLAESADPKDFFQKEAMEEAPETEEHTNDNKQ